MMVTDVAPAWGPLFGLTAVTVGAGVVGEVVRARGGRGASRGGHRDVDRAGPGRRGGRDDVALLTTTPVPGLAPKSTAVAPVKPVPVTVTEVPPAWGPLFGLTAVTVGAAAL